MGRGRWLILLFNPGNLLKLHCRVVKYKIRERRFLSAKNVRNNSYLILSKSQLKRLRVRDAWELEVINNNSNYECLV